MASEETAPSHLLIEPLNPQHDRQSFHCGVESLDRYFIRQAGQDARKRVAAPFLLLDTDSGEIIGYYTLSMSSILTRDLPADLSKKLPRYEAMPAILLGRLAVNQTHQGKGYGETLLYDALHRSLENPIAATLVIVEALSEQAKAFYMKHGFLSLPDQPMRLFLPMRTVEAIFGSFNQTFIRLDP